MNPKRTVGSMPFSLAAMLVLFWSVASLPTAAVGQTNVVEVDYFPDTVGLVWLVGGPLGPAPVPFTLRGPTEVHVLFEYLTEGDAHDNDGNGLDEVEAYLVSMNLTDGDVTLRIRGLSASPFAWSGGLIEELANNIPGRLDLDPFHQGDADSFFDVFFEIELPGGTILHNEQPVRMAATISEKPPLARYVAVLPQSGPVELLDENNDPTGISITRAEHITGPGNASIHGFKYEDVDGDSRYAPDVDNRKPGVTITLTGDVDGDHAIDTLTTVTDGSGEFGFMDLHPGTYRVAETTPLDWYPTTAPAMTVTVYVAEEIVALPGQAGITGPYDPRREVGDLVALARELGCTQPAPPYADAAPVHVFRTELLSMELAGAGAVPLGPRFTDVQSEVVLRQSDSVTSTGADCVRDVAVDQYHVDSFFDVFFDITITDVDPQANYMGMVDGARILFQGVGPSRMSCIYVGLPPAANTQPEPFNFLPPAADVPYVGFSDVELPLGDMDGDDDLDYLVFTLATHHVNGAPRSYIQLPAGEVIDSFDLTTELSGAITDKVSTQPFTISGLEGPGETSRQILSLGFGNMQEHVVERDVFPHTVGQILLELPTEPGIVTPRPDLPPTDGEYRSAGGVHAVYRGPELEIVLQDVRHRPLSEPAPVRIAVGPDEREDFMSSLRGLAVVTSVLLGLDGELVRMELTGPVQTIVRDKADVTTGRFDAEIVEMTLVGEILPGVEVAIQESPSQASTGQTAITDLGGGLYHIDSFFDVFTELSVDGGPWIQSTDSTRVVLVQPGIVGGSSDLPATDGAYLSPQAVHAMYSGPDLEIVLQNVRHRALAFPMPIRAMVGNDEIETFESTLRGVGIVTMPSMGLDGVSVPVALTGPVETRVADRLGHDTGTFQTEIVSMELSGEVPVPGGGPMLLAIRESPALPSAGQTTIRDLGNGQFAIDSFFDVFTELSVDGGQGWTPAVDDVRVELSPVPRLVPMVGPAEAHVFFEGPTEGDAGDDTGNDRDEVETELVSLDLRGVAQATPIRAGVRGDQVSPGRIEEHANDTPGRLDLDPFHPGTADSFFDVWTEITLGGQVLVTEMSIRLETPIAHKPPEDGERYTNPRPVRVELIDQATGQGTGIYVLRKIHQPNPTTEVDPYPRATAMVELAGGSLGGVPVPFIMDGPAEAHVYFEGPVEGDAVDDSGEGLDEVVTELIAMNLTDGNATLRVRSMASSPFSPSLGLIEEQANNNVGRLDQDPFHPGVADSFFDVFFEIELPDGSLLHNVTPVRLTGTFDHKPPARGERYAMLGGPGVLYDEADNPTSVMLTDAWFEPYPDIREDWGDAPDGGGRVPGYPTLRTSGGASHVVAPGVALGTGLDDEPDGQPSLDALGDDNDIDPLNPLPNYDDEDGVFFASPLIPGYLAYVQVVAATAGVLSAWIDYDADSSWNEPGDQILFDEPLVAGMNTLSFLVDPFAAPGLDTYARFRFSTAGGLGPGGSAADGEVEDMAVAIEGAGSERGDWGDAPEPYPTLAGHALGGAVHVVGSGLYLGYRVDSEPDGQPSADALGDDADIDPLNPVPNVDDEDGLRDFSVLTSGIAGGWMELYVNAGPGAPAFLNAFIDFAGDGNWSGAGDQVITNAVVADGVNLLPFPVPPGTPPTVTYARLRLASVPGLLAHGSAPDGEVEDYRVVIHPEELVGLDGGDAPEPYPTLAAAGGAVHSIVPDLYLGAGVDGERDGQPGAAALGDDADLGGANPPPNYDDEDGVQFTTPLVMGKRAFIDVRCGPAPALLDAWIDFDGNGNWEAAEHLFGGASLPLVPGLNSNIVFPVPLPCVAGWTYARFRLSLEGGLPPTGPAEDGEVEDHLVLIRQPAATLDDGLVITAANRGEDTVEIVWTSVSNRVYQLVARPSLVSPPSWTGVNGQVIGPASQQVDNASAVTARFYRVTIPYVE